jgi:hypothetical protein
MEIQPGLTFAIQKCCSWKNSQASDRCFATSDQNGVRRICIGSGSVAAGGAANHVGHVGHVGRAGRVGRVGCWPWLSWLGFRLNCWLVSSAHLSQ